MGDSTCVACGECVQACPTGALMPKTRDRLAGGRQARSIRSARSAASAARSPTTCKDDKIVSVDGRDGPANHGRLCVKGRFGFDYAHHPQRLTEAADPQAPACRRTRTSTRDPARLARGVPRSELGRGAGRSPPASSSALRDTHGPKALAGFGSAKGSNEEAYLFQKLVRTGFGSNNVDHCTRLCHASSVAALLEGVGSGAVSATRSTTWSTPS